MRENYKRGPYAPTPWQGCATAGDWPAARSRRQPAFSLAGPGAAAGSARGGQDARHSLAAAKHGEHRVDRGG